MKINFKQIDFKKHRKKIYVIAAAVIFIGAFLIFLQRGNTDGVIYRNVYIHGVAVGGMNAEEAEAALMERFQAGLDTRIVRYLTDSAEAAAYTFADFGARFDFTELVESAVEYSTSRRILRRIARATGRRHEISATPVFIFDADKVEAVMQKISAKVDVPAVNASFYEEGGHVTVKPEKTGRRANMEAAAAETLEILRSLADGEVHLQISAAVPLHTAESFNFKPSVLGSYETRCYSDGDDPRRRNIIRAAEKINNITLYPGEIFSAGRIIAANIPDSGYETAIILLDGEAVEGIGGGVCQVVTTLYNAVLRAELEIVQRHNHSARVSYVDVGFDATVAGDYYDLKFKNNTGRPLLITSRVRNNRLYVGIHGYEARDPARSIRFEVRQVELIRPEPYREIVDPAIPRGQRVVTLESQMGYHVELYKIIYKHGEEVEQEKINTSVYKPLQGVIAIGAG